MVKPNDRHSRHNNPKDAHAPTAEQLEQREVEEVDLELEKSPREHDKTSSGRIGNAAVAMALATGTPPPTNTGNASRAAQLRKRNEDEEQETGALAFGGPPEPPPDRPFEITDLTATWRPRVRQKRDILARANPTHVEQEDDPVFTDFLKQCQEATPFLVNMASSTIDPLIQPTPHLFRGTLTVWAQFATQDFPNSSENEQLRKCILAPPSTLEDFRTADPLHGAVRRAALASLGLSTHADTITSADIAHITFRLELQSRAHEIQTNSAISDADSAKKIDTATAQFNRLRPTSHRGRVTTSKNTLPPPELKQVLSELIQAPAFSRFIPHFPKPVEHANNDPLGIDAILHQHTGQQRPHQKDIAKIVESTSERFAVNIASLARSFGALAAAVSDISAYWSAGAPSENLQQVLQNHDEAVRRYLRMLIEITKAGIEETVPPKGLINGYKRVAKGMNDTTSKTLSAIADIITAILPKRSTTTEISTHFDTGTIYETGQKLLDAAKALSAKDWAQAETSAKHLANVGLNRRNGLLYLSSVLTLLEVYSATGEVDAVMALRTRAGATLIQMSQLEGVRILANWNG